MKKGIVLGLLLSATLISSCGGSNTSSGGNGQVATVPIVNLELDLNELKTREIEVTFWHTFGASNRKILDNIIKEFNKIYPKIKITHNEQGGYDDLRKKIVTAIPALETPVMAVAYPDHVAEYIDAGASVSLNSYVVDPVIGFNAKDGISDIAVNGDGIDDFIPEFWSEGTKYDEVGNIYSVPYAKSTEAIFMNTTFMQKNKLTVDGTTTGNPIVPTKWENEENPNDLTAMINLCRKIKAINPNVTPLGYDSDDNLFITLLNQLGLPYTSISENNGKVTGKNEFATNGAVEMVTKIKKWFDEGLIVTKGTLPNKTYTSDKFTTGELIMSIGSTGGTSYNQPSSDEQGAEFNVEVFPIPQYNSDAPKVILQGPSVTFFKNTKIDKYQTAAAWMFYKFATNTKNTAAWACATGYEPVRKSAFESARYQEHLNPVDEDGNPLEKDLFQKVANMTKEQINNYFTSAAFKGSATTRQQVGTIISSVCKQDFSGKTPAEITTYIQRTFETAIRESELAKG